MATPTPNIKDKLEQDKINKLLQDKLNAFVQDKGNKEFFDRFEKHRAQNTHQYTPGSHIQSFTAGNARAWGGIIPFFMEQYLTKSQSQFEDTTSMTAEDLKPLQRLIADCLALEGNSSGKKYLYQINGYASATTLMKNMLDTLIQAGVALSSDSVKPVHEKTYRNILSRVAASARNTFPFLKILLDHYSFTDEAYADAIKTVLENVDDIKTNLKEKENIKVYIQVATDIQQYRIRQHSKKTIVTSTAVASNSKVAMKNTKEDTDSYYTKWVALITMELHSPGYMNKSHNKKMVDEIMEGFKKQYGFHPMLSDEELAAQQGQQAKEEKDLRDLKTGADASLATGSNSASSSASMRASSSMTSMNSSSNGNTSSSASSSSSAAVQGSASVSISNSSGSNSSNGSNSSPNAFFLPQQVAHTAAAVAAAAATAAAAAVVVAPAAATTTAIADASSTSPKPTS